MFAFDQQNNNSPNTIINYYNTITDTGQLTSLISGISNDFYNFYNSQTEINNNITNQINSTWSSLHSQINNTYNNLAYQTYILNSSINNIEAHLENITNQTAYFKNVYYTYITDLYDGLGDILESRTYDRYIGFTYTYITTEHGEIITASTDTTTFTYFTGFNTSKYPFQDSGTKTGLAWKSDIPTFPDTTDFLLSTAYDDLTEKIDSATSGLNYSMWSKFSSLEYDISQSNLSFSNTISGITRTITKIQTDTSKINSLSSSITNLNTIINNFSSNVYQTINNNYTNLTSIIRNTYTNLTNIINNHTISINTRINKLSSSITNIFESINSINFKLQNNTLTPMITQLMACPAITTSPVAIITITDTKQELVYNLAGGHFWNIPTGPEALAPGWEDVYQWLFGEWKWTKVNVYNGTADWINRWKDSYWWEVINTVNACNERMTLSPFAMRFHTFMTATAISRTWINGAPYTARFVANKTRRITNFKSYHYNYQYPPKSGTATSHTCYVCDKKLFVSAPLSVSAEDYNTYTSFLEYRPYLLNNYFITSLYVINPYNSPTNTTEHTTYNFYADMTIDRTKLKQLDVLYDNNFILGWADNWESICCSGESVYIPISMFPKLETFRLHVMNDEEFDYRGLHDTFNIIVEQNYNLKFLEFKIGPTFQTMTMSYRFIDSYSGRANLFWMFPSLETLIFYPNLYYSGFAANQSQTFTIQYENLFSNIRLFTKLKHIELGLFDDWFRYPPNSTNTAIITMNCSPSYLKVEGYAPHYSNWKFPSFNNTNNENITVDLSNFKWRYYYAQSYMMGITLSDRPPEPEEVLQVIPAFKTGTVHILLNANMYKYLSRKINDIMNTKWNTAIMGDKTRYKFYYN